MGILKIRNWDKWQSYRRDRGTPPWIKIHRRLQHDANWASLGDAQRGQLVAMWLLAADRDGVIPSCPKTIRKLCMMDSDPDLALFQRLEFIEECQDGVTMASAWRQPDRTEEEIESESEVESEADTEVEKKSKKKKSSRAVGAPIPEDWEPDITDLAWAKEKGYQGEDLKTQTEMMKNWALSNANRGVARKLDWSKTWRNWVMRNLGNHVKAQQQSRTQAAMQELRNKYGNGRPINGNGDSRLSPEFVHPASAEPHGICKPTHSLVYREADVSFEEDG